MPVCFAAPDQVRGSSSARLAALLELLWSGVVQNGPQCLTQCTGQVLRVVLSEVGNVLVDNVVRNDGLALVGADLWLRGNVGGSDRGRGGLFVALRERASGVL